MYSIKMAQNLICLSTYDKQCRNSNLFGTCLLELLKQVWSIFRLNPTPPALRPACCSSVPNRDSPNVDKHKSTNSGRELTTQKDRNKNHANKIHYCVQMYSEHKQFRNSTYLNITRGSWTCMKIYLYLIKISLCAAASLSPIVWQMQSLCVHFGKI